jgi:hypothetical protein
MMKPSFVFDGRNILDVDVLREIGFVVYAIGKPLDARYFQTLPSLYIFSFSCKVSPELCHVC